MRSRFSLARSRRAYCDVQYLGLDAAFADS